MILITPQQKRARDEDPENPGACRDRPRRLFYGSIHDFDCQAYVPKTGILGFKLSTAFERNWAYVALFVYSQDFTPQAVEDLCNIQKHAYDLKKRKILPMAMSTDSVLVHQAFVQRIPGECIDFPILSDTVRLVSSHLKVLDTTKGCSKRAMFLINADRMVLISHILDINAPYPIGAIHAKLHDL